MAAGLLILPEEIGEQLDRLWEEASVQAACTQLARLEPWIRRQQMEASRIPAPTGLEGLRAEWMLQQFRRWGWESGIDAAGNVVALRAGASDAGGPMVAFTAHLDTAFPAGTAVEPHFQHGKLHGPGIGDNGAGLAALLALARVVQEGGLTCRRTLALIANVGEEGEGNLRGMRHLFEQSPLAARLAFTLVVDGPGCEHITVGALGSRRIKVTWRGKGGHSWSEAGAASAIHALGRAIAALLARAPAEPGRAACNVGLIEGGSAVNAIAASATMKLDLRGTDRPRLEALTQSVREAVEAATEDENRAAASGHVEAQWEVLGERPWGQLDPHAALWTAVRLVDERLGVSASPQIASTDANIPLSLGREAIRLGAGGRGGGAHTLEEWFDPVGREMALKRLLLTGLVLAS